MKNKNIEKREWDKNFCFNWNWTFNFASL